MILSDLRRYLKLNGRAALEDIATHLNADREALKGMLDQWQARGQVRRLPSGTPCAGGCCKCDPATVEIYEWCESEGQ